VIDIELTTGTAAFTFLQTAATADDPVIDLRHTFDTTGSIYTLLYGRITVSGSGWDCLGKAWCDKQQQAAES
tara:strand:- start:7303 stop:7518 length:216 start_codon:yes stop_codon:yes gene_type:complete